MQHAMRADNSISPDPAIKREDQKVVGGQHGLDKEICTRADGERGTHTHTHTPRQALNQTYKNDCWFAKLTSQIRRFQALLPWTTKTL